MYWVSLTCIYITWHMTALGVASNQTRPILKAWMPASLAGLIGLLAAVTGA